jgi:hypothetical protein
MRAAIMKTYRNNRAGFSASDLKRYGGQWVAFSADGCRILASGENIAQVSERVNAAQEDLREVVLERIEIKTDDIHMGGAELL